MKVAKVLTDILGKPIEHVKLSEEGSSKWMQSKGIPSEMAGFLAQLDVQISGGAEDRLNTTVKDVTGKAPMAFRDFVEANKDVWM